MASTSQASWAMSRVIDKEIEKKLDELRAVAGRARQGKTCNHARGRIHGLLLVLKR